MDTDIEKQPVTGPKLHLNLRAVSSDVVRAISQGTLDEGGYRPMEPGNRMADESVYAGMSPEKQRPMYVTRFDVSLLMTFNDAVASAATLDAHGHSDWIVPTKDELGVIEKSRDAIGNFTTTGPDDYSTYYWSSTPLDSFSVYSQDMSRKACSATNSKRKLQRLRCVRYG